MNLVVVPFFSVLAFCAGRWLIDGGTVEMGFVAAGGVFFGAFGESVSRWFK